MMTKPDYEIEIMVDGEDQVTAIKPPVDTAFREQMYDILDGMGLMKEIVVRGNFFEDRHLPDGSRYSELRIASTALSVHGQRFINIAYDSADVLRSQDNTVTVSPHLITAGGTRKLFDNRG